jgi:hypothetical protein
MVMMARAFVLGEPGEAAAVPWLGRCGFALPFCFLCRREVS